MVPSTLGTSPKDFHRSTSCTPSALASLQQNSAAVFFFAFERLLQRSTVNAAAVIQHAKLSANPVSPPREDTTCVQAGNHEENAPVVATERVTELSAGSVNEVDW